MNAPRPARMADASEIARLAGELGYPVDAATMVARLEALAADPRQCVCVIDREGALGGWIAVARRLSLEGGERVEITGLVVDSTVRRGGVGRSLAAAAEAWAREQGVGLVLVRSNVQRRASHPFYEGLGYVRNKSQHVYTRHLG
ncbi:GNAT family N-acetyltransferase [Frateuria terrea]|uniref:N-acetylglutamate synthase, GNAT family n=1 Tax=Frateuria terrea TaxID=529704 RepID=A0A1H6U2T8_9GAMM|nr:GNAT family N-acetyltransferase [Frateuria terrea]SEI82720.1 N-acetylglutamate synthase, GNAT family [Frateuria terrea]SFP40649.1 N-acetylglutamate synthase, GNAT family [Frateuria terrea]